MDPTHLTHPNKAWKLRTGCQQRCKNQNIVDCNMVVFMIKYPMILIHSIYIISINFRFFSLTPKSYYCKSRTSINLPRHIFEMVSKRISRGHRPKNRLDRGKESWKGAWIFLVAGWTNPFETYAKPSNWIISPNRDEHNKYSQYLKHFGNQPPHFFFPIFLKSSELWYLVILVGPAYFLDKSFSFLSSFLAYSPQKSRRYMDIYTLCPTIMIQRFHGDFIVTRNPTRSPASHLGFLDHFFPLWWLREKGHSICANQDPIQWPQFTQIPRQNLPFPSLWTHLTWPAFQWQQSGVGFGTANQKNWGVQSF